MIDITQLLLVIVVIVLTVLLVFVGYQVVFILKECRESIKKMNKMLDDFGVISESIAKPIASASGFLTGLKSGANLIKLFTSGKDDEEDEEEEHE